MTDIMTTALWASAIKRLLIYLRRSRDDGAREAFSLSAQRDGCLRFAREVLGITSAEIIEYIDDDRARDDFEGREGLLALLADIEIGDVVVARDQDRIGAGVRVVAVLETMKASGARIFFYSDGDEVKLDDETDELVRSIKATMARGELRKIRSRTREALRYRVRQGRIAGGRCYGYRNIQSPDPDGKRKNTVAVVDEVEAVVIRRIVVSYLDGSGLSKIAKMLNRESVPAPFAGTRRGTKSWSPSAIREILRRERYKGTYVHGRVDRVRRGGKRVARLADPTQIIRVEIPEWRIIGDIQWQAVQEKLAMRSKLYGGRRVSTGRPAAYPLTGLAKCGVCGGSIILAHTKGTGGVRVQAYACSFHKCRGPEVCPVKLHQDRQEVEGALADYLRDRFFIPAIVEDLLALVRAAAEHWLAAPAADVAVLEDERTRLRAEQKKYAAAIALADDVPELAAELRLRSDRLRQVEADLAAARRGPVVARELLLEVEKSVRRDISEMREALISEPALAQRVYRRIFPDGLTFRPAAGARRVWEIEGTAKLATGGFPKSSDPTASRDFVYPEATVEHHVLFQAVRRAA